MATLSCVCIGVSMWLGMCSVGGHVVDEQGQPMAGAQVFAEPGLSGPVRATQSDAAGAFRFEDLEDGPVGIFAIAAGYGFGGSHLNLAIAEQVADLRIDLPAAGQISGKVVNHKGKPIAGARITRIGLLGDTKVGIPIAKMKNFGFETPVTNTEGRFTLLNLPQGGKVAIKAGHPDYAQEGVEDVAVGASDLQITLYPGIILEGRVLSKGKETPIANADVIVRNGQPPYDTAVTQSNGFGQFTLRLKPGIYLYQASTEATASSGWEKLTITGEKPAEHVTAYLAGSAGIRGTIKDAKTGNPIAGARILADANGNRAAIVYSGPTGEFQVRVAAGETVIRLETAPGYLPPETGAIRIAVAEGQDIELPGMWLAPAPRFRLQVLAEDGQSPASGVAVSVLRPRQFGWYIADAEGRVEISMLNLPADGKIIGMAESLSQPLGALFSLSRADEPGAKVQLLRLSEIHGVVNGDNGNPIEGAVVGAVFPGESADEDLLLWRCLSRTQGVFSWDAVIPGVPQICMARAGAQAEGESAPFNLEPGASKDIGPLTVPGGVSVALLNGKKVPWYENKLICGPVIDAKIARNAAAMVVYCPASQADMVIAGLESVRKTIGTEKLTFAVIVSGAYSRQQSDFSVLAGVAPGSATTYLIGNGGVVLEETFGLPPAHRLVEFSKQGS